MRWRGVLRASCSRSPRARRANRGHARRAAGRRAAHPARRRSPARAYDARAAARYGLERSRYEGPTGIVGVLQDACVAGRHPGDLVLGRACRTTSSQPPNPKATLALLHRVEEVLDIAVPLAELPEQADEWQKLVDEMAAEDDEVAEYIRKLEERDERRRRAAARRPATRSPRSSSATCAAAAAAGGGPAAEPSTPGSGSASTAAPAGARAWRRTHRRRDRRRGPVGSRRTRASVGIDHAGRVCRVARPSRTTVADEARRSRARLLGGWTRDPRDADPALDGQLQRARVVARQTDRRRSCIRSGWSRRRPAGPAERGRPACRPAQRPGGTSAERRRDVRHRCRRGDQHAVRRPRGPAPQHVAAAPSRAAAAGAGARSGVDLDAVRRCRSARSHCPVRRRPRAAARLGQRPARITAAADAVQPAAGPSRSRRPGQRDQPVTASTPSRASTSVARPAPGRRRRPSACGPSAQRSTAASARRRVQVVGRAARAPGRAPARADGPLGQRDRRAPARQPCLAPRSAGRRSTPGPRGSARPAAPAGSPSGRRRRARSRGDEAPGCRADFDIFSPSSPIIPACT